MSLSQTKVPMNQVFNQETPLTSQNSLAAHGGRQVLEEQGAEGHKGFFIQLEDRLGQEETVVQMPRDIWACVEDEPATGTWFTVQFSQTTAMDHARQVRRGNSGY